MIAFTHYKNGFSDEGVATHEIIIEDGMEIPEKHNAEEDIEARIRNNARARQWTPIPYYQPTLRDKPTGLYALYLHYCYLLGIFPRDRPQNRKRLHFLLREDLVKMDDISKEARLLSRNHIDTVEELFSYRSSCEDRLKALTDERNVLFRKRRTVAVKSDEVGRAEVQEQIDSLTSEIKKLRQEVRLCEDIRVRSGVMKDKIKTVREDEKEKETKLWDFPELTPGALSGKASRAAPPTSLTPFRMQAAERLVPRSPARLWAHRLPA